MIRNVSSGHQVPPSQVALGLCIVGAAAGLAALLATGRRPIPAKAALQSSGPTQVGASRISSLAAGWGLAQPADNAEVAVNAGRRLNRAAGLLAFSVLADSAVEHYRGSFNNRMMYAPLLVSTLTLAVSLHGIADERRGAHRARHATYLAAAATGVVGTGFHLYNILRRPGGWDWQNLFYGAPIGAPAAILLSGLLGAVAEQVRRTPGDTAPEIACVSTGRVMAGVSAAGLLGSTAEAALLHFRGAFHDPFMVLPVTLPPVGALLLGRLAVGRSMRHHPFTRWWLRLVAAMGLAGTGFHAYGVHRNMGGWRNWRQNVLNGPPLPAPPSFTGLALAGLAAVALAEDRPHA